MSKRLAIKDRLESVFTTMNVYQSHVVNSSTEKPYFIVTPMDEQRGNIKYGYDMYYLIFVYADILSDGTDLDTIVDSVKNALNDTLITYGSVKYQIDYLGFYGSSVIEEDWGVIGQGLQFKINNIVESYTPPD